MLVKSLSALVFAMFASTVGFAQSAGGVSGISGVVRDATGSSVPNAKVVIWNESQGNLRSIVTNNDGVFTAPTLDPGPGYKVTVTAPGFSEYEATNLILKVGQNVDLRIELAVGTSTTQVDVTAEAPVLDDSKVDVSTVVDSKSITDFPHRRAARGLFRAADSGRHQRCHLRPPELPGP